MESSFRLIRIRGIDIGANWSWLAIFGVIVWSLATYQFPVQVPGQTGPTYWGMAAAAGFLFVVSLLLHELGHAFRAQREGMTIEGITLWLFGGVAKFKGSFPSAGAEFRIAIAGPLVTVVLFLVFWVAQRGADAVGAPISVIGVLDQLAFINGSLLVFNMLPGLPLDGGRVLRAHLWQRSGSYTAATMSAARVARVIAGTMIAVGALLTISTGQFSYIWLAFIGFFLMQAAQAEVSYALFKQSLGGVTVADLMTPDPDVVDASRSIASFLDDAAYVHGHSTYPVVEHGQPVGLISLRLAAGVPIDERPTTLARDAMVPIDQVASVDRDEDITSTVQQMQQGHGRALVTENGRMVGILSMADVARAIELEQVRAGPAEQAVRKSPWLWVLAAIFGLGIIGWFYAPPFVVIAPGEAFDVTGDITVKGIETDEVRGQYLLTSVAVSQPNVWGLVFSISQGRELLPISAIVPPDVDQEDYFEQQEELFKEAQTVAAAAAAKAAGLDVKLDGSGAVITNISSDAPADGVLQTDDVVVSLNGRRIRFADEMSSAVRSRPAGTKFSLEIERDGKREQVEVTSQAGVARGAPGIGVMIVTKDFDFELPFEITFKAQEIGGPSAGLAYALAIYDILDEGDTARGRVIATTGTVDLDGNVGAIGGVEEKAIAAQAKGAKVFLVPDQEVRDAGRSQMEVIGVSTIADAIAELRS